MLAFMLLSYAIAIVAIVILYIYYGGEGCGLNKFFISMTLILAVVVSIISILPKIQVR